MAISIKSSPVLTGITAKRFDALVEQNKSIDARTLSETEKNQIVSFLASGLWCEFRKGH